MNTIEPEASGRLRASSAAAGGEPPPPLWALLDPRRRALPLVGRADELRALWHWLETPRPLSVRTLIGGSGTGKTRLAAEFVHQVASSEHQGWNARFVEEPDWAGWLSPAESRDPSRLKPTLLVVDHAASRVDRLRQFLREAGDRREACGLPLRLLLLAREASPEEGWLRCLQEGVLPCLDSPWPVRLPRLPDSCIGRLVAEVAEAMSDRFGGLPARAEGIGRGLEMNEGYPGWPAVEPARLVMAAALALACGGSFTERLGQSRSDLAFALAALESERLAGSTPMPDADARRWMAHLAACATVLGGVLLEELVDVAEEEGRALRWEGTIGARAWAEWLWRACAGHGALGVGVAHEPVGEALVLGAIGGRVLGEAGACVLRRLVRRRPAGVSDFLLRLAGDFGDLRHPEALEWLGLMLDASSELSIGWLLEAERVLPLGRPGLRELSLELSGRVVGALQRRVPGLGSRALMAECARVQGRLSWRLSDFGRREEARAHAEQGEQVCRALARDDPDRHESDWIAALGVLARRLADLGRWDESLARASQAEAVGARSVVQAEPGAVRGAGVGQGALPRPGDDGSGTARPGEGREAGGPAEERSDRAVERWARWAGALEATAAVLERAGRFEEAREKIALAVATYKGLANRETGAFQPELAAAGSRLAVVLARTGSTAEALEMVWEGRGACAGCPPDSRDWAWACWASSLGALAGHWLGAGAARDALDGADWAVEAWRELAQRQPAAFLPDLGRALRLLALALAGVGRGEDALTTLGEALAVFRDLARVDPGGYLSELAVTLLARAGALSAQGRWTAALESVRESESMLQPLAEARPGVFLSLWARALALEGACHRGVPCRTDELEHYGRAVMECCARTHTRSTFAGSDSGAEPEDWNAAPELRPSGGAGTGRP